jgi:GxxExxY protein
MGLLYEQESYQILGACFEVYKELGCGFLESVYQEALELELQARGIPFQPQPELRIWFKSQLLKKTFQPDFICYEKIVIELKAVSQLIDEFRAQLHNYLKATNHRLGFLVNFGHHPKLEYERIVH